MSVTCEYFKGSVSCSGEDWYHGQLTREEANQVLREQGNDCFLVRESKGALVLSLRYGGNGCHIKIKYGPGWYKLESDLVQKSFAELEELFSYYRSHTISDKLKVRLGEVCKKSTTTKEHVTADLPLVASTVYAKACPSASDKAWYHGEMTGVEAEQALLDCAHDCYLIRESARALILSHLHKGRVRHINIKYGPGWYELESNCVHERFTELEALVAHYQSKALNVDEPEIKLTTACEKISSEALSRRLQNAEIFPHPSYPPPDIYSQGEPVDIMRYEWYHGNITEEQATQELKSMSKNSFLVRQSKSDLILSHKVSDAISHKKIHRTPEGYGLQGREKKFPNVPDMMTYYKQFPVDTEVLGESCDKILSELDAGIYDVISEDPANYHWYHEDITKEQATVILKMAGMSKSGNCFLVHPSEDGLTLSYKVSGWISSDAIVETLKGHHLQGKTDFFKTVPELIGHYQKFSIREDGMQLLGNACDRKDSELRLSNYKKLEKKKTFKEEDNLFKLKWKKIRNLPSPRSAPEIVKIGRHIYVGGGMAESDPHVVYKYSLSQHCWTSLPECPTYQHSLTALNSELLALGGKRDEEIQNTVYTLKGNKWKEVLPPIPTARFFFSTATHENRIIVTAGGITDEKTTGSLLRTDTVEIYDAKFNQWYTTKQLPFKACVYSLVILSNTCYITGGDTTPDKSCTTVYATVSSLLKTAEPADSIYSVPQCLITWRQLKGKHPLIYTTLVEMNGKLIAVGGSSEVIIRQGTSFVSAYNFHADTWMECKAAELPILVYRPGVVKLDDNSVMVVGGQPRSQQFSAEAYIGYLV